MPKADVVHTPPARALISGKAAAARLAITTRLDKLADLPASHPDAALIQACIDHPHNLIRHEESYVPNADNDPAWHAYEKTRDAISDAEPQTFAGMAAKAWAAKFEAIQQDGSERPGFPPNEWAWGLVNDLTRLYPVITEGLTQDSVERSEVKL